MKLACLLAATTAVLGAATMTAAERVTPVVVIGPGDVAMDILIANPNSNAVIGYKYIKNRSLTDPAHCRQDNMGECLDRSINDLKSTMTDSLFPPENPVVHEKDPEKALAIKKKMKAFANAKKSTLQKNLADALDLYISDVEKNPRNALNMLFSKLKVKIHASEPLTDAKAVKVDAMAAGCNRWLAEKKLQQAITENSSFVVVQNTQRHVFDLEDFHLEKNLKTLDPNAALVTVSSATMSVSYFERCPAPVEANPFLRGTPADSKFTFVRTSYIPDKFDVVGMKSEIVGQQTMRYRIDTGSEPNPCYQHGRSVDHEDLSNLRSKKAKEMNVDKWVTVTSDKTAVYEDCRAHMRRTMGLKPATFNSNGKIVERGSIEGQLVPSLHEKDVSLFGFVIAGKYFIQHGSFDRKLLQDVTKMVCNANTIEDIDAELEAWTALRPTDQYRSMMKYLSSKGVLPCPDLIYVDLLLEALGVKMDQTVINKDPDYSTQGEALLWRSAVRMEQQEAAGDKMLANLLPPQDY